MRAKRVEGFRAKMEWSTSNLMVHPRETLDTDPTNPAAKPFAGMRTSLSFSARAAEMPERSRAFVAREFDELKSLESNREQACAMVEHAAIKHADERAAFEDKFNALASQHRTIFRDSAQSFAADFSA